MSTLLIKLINNTLSIVINIIIFRIAVKFLNKTENFKLTTVCLSYNLQLTTLSKCVLFLYFISYIKSSLTKTVYITLNILNINF